MQRRPGAVVGRELELERLQAALDGPGAGIFEIVGEPGIGKTRLLAGLSALAQDSSLPRVRWPGGRVRE